MKLPFLRRGTTVLWGPLLAGFVLMSGCDGSETGDDHDHDHEHNDSEVLTTVTLTFTPQDQGDVVVAAFSDPDGDGGVSGSSEPITLVAGTTYDLGIAFTNELEEPAGDITSEIEEEAEEHQIFIAGEGVGGPASSDDSAVLVSHGYADQESSYGADTVGDDLPVGLANIITASTAGTGTLTVRLQHLPELNGTPQKVAGLAERLGMGEALPGDTDAAVEFELTVQ